MSESASEDRSQENAEDGFGWSGWAGERLSVWVGFLIRRWKRIAVLFFGILIPLLGVGALAEDVLEGGLPWDEPILHWIHASSSGPLDQAMVVATDIGYSWGVLPGTIAICLFLLFRKLWPQFTFFLASMVGAVVLNWAAKLAFQRARPSLWNSPVSESSFSFPSGHAMASMAFAVAIIVLLWPRRAALWALIPAVIFVALIGYTRLYLGVHYPSDILAGWGASLGWVLGIASLTESSVPVRERR